MRRTLPALAVLLSLASPVAGADASGADEVRKAEIAFARTMADRDHEAFVSFLAPDAVFLGDDGTPLRGAKAIAEGWKPRFEAETAPFSWEPQTVQVAASGTLAISTGPVRDPSGAEIGRFVSTWRREKDGSWKVVLDTGCGCGRE